MTTVFEDFRTRSSEVDVYFDFVIALAERAVLLQAAPGQNPTINLANDELLKTLKASCYLLLYNLVESTMRNAVEAIFDELRTTRTSFDACRLELKIEVLKNFRKRNSDSLLTKLAAIASDVVHETFVASEAFSGNLDGRAIRETARRYGFAQPTGSQFHLLLTVKNARNDLAHGVKSFVEVGRDATPDDLKDAKAQTIDILNQTLTNIENYLTGQLYLAAP
jgi:hypothetical protein